MSHTARHPRDEQQHWQRQPQPEAAAAEERQQATGSLALRLVTRRSDRPPLPLCLCTAADLSPLIAPRISYPHVAAAATRQFGGRRGYSERWSQLFHCVCLCPAPVGQRPVVLPAAVGAAASLGYRLHRRPRSRLLAARASSRRRAAREVDEGHDGLGHLA